jgi:type I restriction enzyme M protein
VDFGYREIRVERPLKLNFLASHERKDRLKAEKSFMKLDAEEQESVLNALAELPETLFKNRNQFEKALLKVLQNAGIKVGATIKKLILATLSERDETADVCLDKDGKPEADPELRDHELVPLEENWRDFFTREVSPFIPDAWVDENYRDGHDRTVGRIGYEISFNRYFYRYNPPRPVDEIDADLKALEKEIANLLREVVA